MAGLGIGPEDFALFELGDPDDRADALDAALCPKLERIGAQLVEGLSRVVGEALLVQPSRATRRKDEPPTEAFVAFCPADRSCQRAPYLALCLSRDRLHTRVGVKPDADRSGAMRAALLREAGNLARKGKPFRKLRPYMAWDGEELPEIAPAHSAAFWTELAEELSPARAGIDVGIAWTAAEARNLSVGDLLGAYRDLASLFKLLSAAAAAPAPAP